MTETWKNIPGYDGKYQLDRQGNCRRIFKSGKTRPMTPYQKKRNHGSNRYIVKLTKNGKSKEEVLMQLMAITFLGPIPKGCVTHHKNGMQSDNHISNIEYITKKELGKKYGANANRKPVAKLDSNGEIVEVYSSAREAAKKNYMSYQTVIDRCNGKCKGAFAPDGYAYAWEESHRNYSMREAIRKIELANGYMAKAPDVEFEW